MPTETANSPATMAGRLVELRTRLGYSQRGFDALVGASGALVSQWEIGLKAPGRERLAVIAERTGVTTDYLMGVREMTTQMPQELWKQERQLIRLWRASPPTFRQNLINLLFEAGEARRELNAPGEEP